MASPEDIQITKDIIVAFLSRTESAVVGNAMGGKSSGEMIGTLYSTVLQYVAAANSAKK
jgi:hypothetical protein